MMPGNGMKIFTYIDSKDDPIEINHNNFFKVFANNKSILLVIRQLIKYFKEILTYFKSLK